MTPRERVRRAVLFQSPDRIPIRYYNLPGAYDRLGEKLLELYRRYPPDWPLPERLLHSWETTHFAEGSEVDEWGCVWENAGFGIEGQVKVHPLADWSRFDSYEPPDPRTNLDCPWDGKRPAELEDYFVILRAGGGRLFERMHFLRGYESLLEDMVLERERVLRLRDLVLKHTLAQLELQLEIDADAFWFMDDWGTQRQLMIRPDVWRELFKPAYKEIFDRIHKAGKFVFFHSDGYILEIIPDLLELGVDILNPQFSCFQLEELAELCAGRVCVQSDVDRQHLLPRGRPEEIWEYVWNVFRLFGSENGGLIAHAEIGPDVPLRNVEVLLKAFHTLSPYPLRYRPFS
ncbi:MAG: hypothetical protein ONB23_01820 [candidate division KSB1 bacterium]|nr:hypothetical protein [candidate division KSB1 bacterium]